MRLIVLYFICLWELLIEIFNGGCYELDRTNEIRLTATCKTHDISLMIINFVKTRELTRVTLRIIISIEDLNSERFNVLPTVQTVIDEGLPLHLFGFKLL